MYDRPINLEAGRRKRMKRRTEGKKAERVEAEVEDGKEVG